jgi:hypothetical protein
VTAWIAGGWYISDSSTVDISLTDGKAHRPRRLALVSPPI